MINRKLTLEQRIARLERLLKNEGQVATFYPDPKVVRKAIPKNAVYDAVEDLILDGVEEDDIADRLLDDYGFELGVDYSKGGLNQAIISARMKARRR